MQHFPPDVLRYICKFLPVIDLIRYRSSTRQIRRSTVDLLPRIERARQRYDTLYLRRNVQYAAEDGEMYFAERLKRFYRDQPMYLRDVVLGLVAQGNVDELQRALDGMPLMNWIDNYDMIIGAAGRSANVPMIDYVLTSLGPVLAASTTPAYTYTTILSAAATTGDHPGFLRVATHLRPFFDVMGSHELLRCAYESGNTSIIFAIYRYILTLRDVPLPPVPFITRGSTITCDDYEKMMADLGQQDLIPRDSVAYALLDMTVLRKETIRNLLNQPAWQVSPTVVLRAFQFGDRELIQKATDLISQTALQKMMVTYLPTSTIQRHANLLRGYIPMEPENLIRVLDEKLIPSLSYRDIARGVTIDSLSTAYLLFKKGYDPSNDVQHFSSIDPRDVRHLKEQLVKK